VKIIANDPQVAGIDLNLGCPQGIARKGNYGAFLLQDLDRVVSILSSMVNSLDIPVSAKVRVYDTDEKTVHMAQAIESTGVSMISIHGRTINEMKQATGSANWDLIRKVKASVSIPVIANGGISSYSDYRRCLEYTKADAIMSAEGMLENPKLFSPEGCAAFHSNYITSQLSTSREYLALAYQHPTARPSQVIRGHLFKMLYRFVNAPRNTDLRSLLADGPYENFPQVVDEIERRVSVSSVAFDPDNAINEGLLTPTTWYNRHLIDGHNLNGLKATKPADDMNNDNNFSIGRRVADLKEKLLEKQKQRKKING